MNAAQPVDIDSLPPTQWLLLETLTARLRLGEPFWTFPDRLKPVARQLEHAGWLSLRSGPAQGAFQAWPTDRLRADIAASPYRPPTIADGAVGEQIRHAVAAHLIRCYGTLAADALSPLPAIPRDVVALARWLGQESSEEIR